MSKKEAGDFEKKLELVQPGKLRVIVSKRDLHLFAGTHIEAAPGDCKLPDLPPYPGISSNEEGDA